jgi:hypothetical protein
MELVRCIAYTKSVLSVALTKDHWVPLRGATAPRLSGVRLELKIIDDPLGALNNLNYLEFGSNSTYLKVFLGGR